MIPKHLLVPTDGSAPTIARELVVARHRKLTLVPSADLRMMTAILPEISQTRERWGVCGNNEQKKEEDDATMFRP